MTGRISAANAPMAGHDASGHKALLVRMYVLPHHLSQRVEGELTRLMCAAQHVGQ